MDFGKIWRAPLIQVIIGVLMIGWVLARLRTTDATITLMSFHWVVGGFIAGVPLVLYDIFYSNRDKYNFGLLGLVIVILVGGSVVAYALSQSIFEFSDLLSGLLGVALAHICLPTYIYASNKVKIIRQ